MANIDEVFGGSSLKAADLRGREVAVTIKSAKVREFDDGKKIVLTFHGKEKCLVTNKTNAARIAENTGEHDTDNWAGQTIRLYPDRVDFQGRIVDAIRVRLESPVPPQETAAPTAAVPNPGKEDDIPF